MNQNKPIETKNNKITKFRNECDSSYSLKPKTDRFLCFFFTGKKSIVTNSFEKKQDKLTLTEKEKAQKYQNDYLLRVKKGKYYEKK